MHRKVNYIIVSISLIIWLTGCRQESSQPRSTEKIYAAKHSEKKSNIVLFQGKMFNVPSPMEASLLIKNTGIKFDESNLCPIENASSYNTNFKRAVNFGIYGANLGYLNIYEQYPIATKYFSVVKKLSDELGISSFLTNERLNRIESNQNNKDSLVYITSSLFRDANIFLQNNSRNDIAALIIAGGWLEGLYYLTQNINENNHQIILNRIGEQKYPLDNLIDLMRPYYNKQSDDFDRLLKELIELATVFDGVEVTYSYKEPVVYPDKKKTIIKSESKTIINEYQITTITTMVERIRNHVIQ